MIVLLNSTGFVLEFLLASNVCAIRCIWKRALVFEKMKFHRIAHAHAIPWVFLKDIRCHFSYLYSNWLISIFFNIDILNRFVKYVKNKYIKINKSIYIYIHACLYVCFIEKYLYILIQFTWIIVSQVCVIGICFSFSYLLIHSSLNLIFSFNYLLVGLWGMPHVGLPGPVHCKLVIQSFSTSYGTFPKVF